MLPKNPTYIPICIILLFFLSFSGAAEEGMYPLNQLDQNLVQKMQKMGLELSLEEIYNPQGTGLASAVVRLGATASFVSPKGLIVTNHHVAYRAVQRISTPEENFIEHGFLARSREKELPAPGYQASILLSMQKVTDRVLSAVNENMSDLERFMAIDKKKKEIVAEAEAERDVECRIEAMNYGMDYYLFAYFILKDIRLVYVPPRSIGEYGGDIDNWMWPRHCGDFAFLRAYIGPDGKPAKYSKDNLPYEPKSYLKISARGINENDFAMVMGYPGRTYRHLPSFAIEEDQEFRYPFQINTANDLIRIFEEFSWKDKEAAVKLSSSIKSLNNTLKNNQGMLEGLKRTKIFQKKRAEEMAFLEFLNKNPELDRKYGALLSKIEVLYQEQKKFREKRALLRWITRGSAMMNCALIINKWSIEKEKQDMERELGYQAKDLPNIESRLKVAQRSLVPEADKQALEYFIKRALALPAGQKIKAMEKILSYNPKHPDQAISEFLGILYGETALFSAEERVNMLHLNRKDFSMLIDPFIKFAAELEEEREFLNTKEKEFSGAFSRLMPLYLEGIEWWKKSILYPDANRTLRLNFGRVKGYSPQDALTYHYLTSLTGVIEKHTGAEPFDNPGKLLKVHEAKDFGSYVDRNIHDVPVNFLTTNDSTGGNSGSPVLNAKGELIGLLFDGTYEAMYSDYYFNTQLTRSINVDIRYVLFIAEKVDKALNVLEELTIVR
ncbi:MAG: S46 family peptidase [Candidatus Aminicenantes bacterium]|nr:S46 family peptidase [Candidatus Aminicenantes bacterium]